MAQLNGVKTISATEIEYEGARYEKTDRDAQVGDIVRSETREYSGYLPIGAYYLVKYDIEEGVGVSDEDDDFLVSPTRDHEDFSVFRKVTEPQSLLATKRGQLAQLTAEIAQLEAELTIKPGDWVRVIYRSHHDAFSDGDIVRVVLTDTTNIPYNVVSFDGKMSDWTTADSVVKITPTEAKAALLAKIEALFASEVA